MNHSAFATELTRIFNIKHPIMLAGMNQVAGPQLAGAVIKNGGFSVLGGMNYTPNMLRKMIHDLKSQFDNKDDIPFGVDLLLPKVGGETARKTNYDYTNGQLDELIDVIIEEKAKLFVSAVGVPPKYIVDKLHNAGIFVANMVGKPGHAEYALNVGVDMVIAQGNSGGGHTGDIDSMVLIPAVVKTVAGHLSPLTGRQVMVIGAGGIYDGKTLVAALTLGASGVWVGTRFVASVESSAPTAHKQAVLDSKIDDTMKTLVYTGRPLRIAKNDYATDWETGRKAKMEKLLSEGIIPVNYDKENMETGKFEKDDIEYLMKHKNKKPYPHLLGQVAGSIDKIETAADIINSMMREAIMVVNYLHEINTCKLPSREIADDESTISVRAKL